MYNRNRTFLFSGVLQLLQYPYFTVMKNRIKRAAFVFVISSVCIGKGISVYKQVTEIQPVETVYRVPKEEKITLADRSEYAEEALLTIPGKRREYFPIEFITELPEKDENLPEVHETAKVMSPEEQILELPGEIAAPGFENPPEITEPKNPAEVTEPGNPAEVTEPENPPEVTIPENPPEIAEPENPPEVTIPENPAEITEPGEGNEAKEEPTGPLLENGFLIDEEGMIVGICPEEAYIEDGYLELPDHCTGIRKGAFSSCTVVISELYIPGNINMIEEGSFRGLTDLEWMEVDPGNPNYTSINGVIYDSAVEVMVAVPSASTGTQEVPGTVCRISNDALADTRLSALDMRKCKEVEIGSHIFGNGTGAGIVIHVEGTYEEAYRAVFGDLGVEIKGYSR